MRVRFPQKKENGINIPTPLRIPRVALNTQALMHKLMRIDYITNRIEIGVRKR